MVWYNYDQIHTFLNENYKNNLIKFNDLIYINKFKVNLLKLYHQILYFIKNSKLLFIILIIPFRFFLLNK